MSGYILLWFSLAFPWWWAILSTFSCIYWSFIDLLWKNIYSNSLFWLLQPPVSLSSLHNFWHPYSLRHNNIDIRPVNNHTIASKCSSERKSHIPLTLNQKLEWLSLVRKACWTLRQAESYASCSSQVLNAKEKFWRKLKVPLQWTYECKKSAIVLLLIWKMILCSG